MGKKTKISFDDHFAAIYGERWKNLRKALVEAPETVPFSDGLTTPYYMDAASFFPPNALCVSENDTVLDMCAAPGGKTLVLAVKLGAEGSLTANDRSANRRVRLQNVLDSHLPMEKRKRIRVTGHDACRFGLYEKEAYTKVLADVPCSSERHIVRSYEHLAQWSPARSRQLVIRQTAIICAAADVVKPGGIIVYSTCSISPEENDGIIEKLLKKREGMFTVAAAVDSPGEETAYGRRIFPDTCGGIGPIYYSVLWKNVDTG